MSRRYLACDLGAESGRLMLGTLAEGKLQLEEIHRFANTPVQSAESLLWDIPHLVEELRAGLSKAAARKLEIASISTDSWGVDYLLIGPDSSIISPTYHYRDARTNRGVDRALALVDWKTLFNETGIQFMPLNTVFQLAAEDPGRLEKAAWVLGIGDGFNYLLGGKPVAEQSMASTFQLTNPRTQAWSDFLIGRLGFPRNIFPEIVKSGTPIGELRPDLAKGLAGVRVVASCSHDTGAAVAAVPATPGNWAYLSSGTWSLMGIETAHPIITDASRDLNFTNEIGYGSNVRLLKNIIGLWLVQECRRQWARQGASYDYGTLTQLAAKAPPFVSLINPADSRFLRPENMPAEIAAFCRETAQPVPEEPGAVIRCALESLALLYRRTLLQIEQLAGRKLDRIHVVGGGSKNDLLNQFTANALQIPVLAGPVEATAAGNVLVQAITLGDVPSLAAARKIVRESSEIRIIEPGPAPASLEAYGKFNRWF